MAVKDIIEGHVNEFLNKNQELSEARLTICRACPLHSNKAYGETCNNDLFLNPNTNETSYYPKNGFYRGCGCRLKAKTTVATKHCPAKKW